MITAENLEAATIGAPSAVLDDLSRQLWRCYSGGEITDVDAEAVSAAIEARRTALRTPRPPRLPKPPTPKPQPRVDAKALERRRSLSILASRTVPLQILSALTESGRAIAVVVRRLAGQGGRGTAAYLAKIASLAGVCKRTARRALRQLADLGYVTITEQRRPKRHGRFRSGPNIITIAKAVWKQLWFRCKRIDDVRRTEMSGPPVESIFSLFKAPSMPSGTVGKGLSGSDGGGNRS